MKITRRNICLISLPLVGCLVAWANTTPRQPARPAPPPHIGHVATFGTGLFGGFEVYRLTYNGNRYLITRNGDKGISMIPETLPPPSALIEKP